MPLIRMFCLFVVVLVPGTGYGAGLQTLEQGTWDIGRGMVGAVTAADSAATAFYNPAGMTKLDRPTATGGMMGIIGETRFDPKVPPTDVISTSRGGNQSGNTVAPAGPFYVHPLNEEWSLGFSVTAPFVGTLDPRDDWPGRYQLTKLDLTTYRFSPAAAYRVNDWLSLGATIGINYTDLGLRVAVPTGGADGGVRVKDADQWVVNFSLGAMIEPFEGTRIGLTYISEVDNDDLSGDFTLAGVGPGFASSVDIKFTLPQAGIIGVRQELGDDLVVFASALWADFSSFSSLGLDTSGALAGELKTHFRDTVGYGVAAEYQLAPDWLLSAGVSYASSPVRGQNRLVVLPLDRQYRYGAGVRHMLSEDLTLGLSYEYLDLGNARLTNSGPGGTVSGDYHKNKVQFIALTLSKAF